MSIDAELNLLGKRCLAKCRNEQWSRDWSNGGCYLHLEVSEFIEALRGKRGEPSAEAADILFVYLAMLTEHSINMHEVLAKVKALAE